ncbi:MAG TPA: hypothetical protein VFM18_20520, partial [Methanosarcina sp.]|nr:hypothetical protein [Methanosarcina sp.]
MMESSQTTLRDALEASFDKVEAGSQQIEPAVIESPEPAKVIEQPRDETGKFAPKEAEKAETQPEAISQETQEEKPTRPTTWKKEFLPIWDKLSAGQALTPE